MKLYTYVYFCDKYSHYFSDTHGQCDLNNLCICFACVYQAYPSDEKSMAKTQTIVLRHLYLLLGYNQNERGFYVPPQRLRYDHVAL
jgi:hypothetical protein